MEPPTHHPEGIVFKDKAPLYSIKKYTHQIKDSFMALDLQQEIVIGLGTKGWMQN